ncbi:B-cell receptor CD22-like isoform X2 [Heterodontus francisci]|uniref:B-cell receptor CD22-like isoform X2 n=1 Tax=Heterodontus francisci TaxID=7792 RepID=UPI00355C2DD8
MQCFPIIFLLASVICDVACTQWLVTTPSVVTGAEDSCLVIPCRYRYPIKFMKWANKDLKWLFGNKTHGTQVISGKGTQDPRFQGRTVFAGKGKYEDCTLMIKKLKKSDEGTYYFRMEFDKDNKYSGPDGVLVSISENASSLITITAPTEIVEGTKVNVTCSVRYLCTGMLRWYGSEGLNKSKTTESTDTSHNGWVISLTLNFIASYKDHKRVLRCGLTTVENESYSQSITLNVKYAPNDVYITSSQMTPFRERDTMTLTCVVSSSNPSVTSYRWYSSPSNRIGTSQQTLTIRHLYSSNRYHCEATNSVGKTSSEELKLVILRDNMKGVWAPLSLRAREDSCVIIPCQFRVPNNVNHDGKTVGMWLKDDNYDGTKVYHSDGQTNVTYIGRTEFLGNIENGNCSLKIKDLTTKDSAKYYFRIEMGRFKWSQKAPVRLLVSENPETPVIKAAGRFVEGESSRVTCSVRSLCPEDVPILEWNAPYSSYASETWQDYRENAWIYSRNVTFIPKYEERDQVLRCTAHFGLKRNSVVSELKVDLKYCPKNISASLTVKWREDESPMKEGDYVTLKCEASSSNPSVRDYRWYRNGTGIDVGWSQMLSFSPISYADFGVYYCEASNDIGSNRSEEIRVWGQYRPRDFRITYSVNGEKVKDLKNLNETDDVNVTCVSTNSDPPVLTYQWFKRHGYSYQTEGDQTLVFHNINPQNSGDYYCQAKNKIGQGDSDSLRIDIQYAPTDVKINAPSFAQDGRYIILRCQCSAYPAVQTYSWRRKCNGDSSVPCPPSSVCSVRVSLEQAACVYFCTAKNLLGEKESEPKLFDVQYPPRNVEIISVDSADEGDVILFSCVNNANPVAYTFHWRKRCNRGDRNLSEKSPSLSWKITSDDVSCNYYCQAQNTIGTQESAAKRIHVNYPPKDTKVVSSESSEEVVEGKMVTFTCNSRSSHPPQYTWYKGSVNNSPIIETGQTLTLHRVSSQHSGQYYCKAENMMGHWISQPIHINVLYGPRNTKVSITRPRNAIRDGDNVTLTCSSEGNPPVSSFRWTWRQGGTTISLQPSSNDLTLYKITREKEGLYFCEAQNKVRSQLSEGCRIDVQTSYINLRFIILALLVFFVLLVAFVTGIFIKRRKKGNSLNRQHNDVPNTVYSVVMKKNKPRETTTYENMVMLESMDRQSTAVQGEGVQYASISFTKNGRDRGPQHQEAARNQPMMIMKMSARCMQTMMIQVRTRLITRLSCT